MLYIAQWQGAGTRSDPYRPVGIENFDGLAWGALDLRPTGTGTDGVCLLYVPASARTVSGLVKMGEDPDDSLSLALRTVIRNRLQLGVDDDDASIPSPRKLLERLMFIAGRRWRPVMSDRAGRKFVHIAGKQWAFRQINPPIGDELIDPTDTFTRADENPATGWTQTGSALRVIGNRLANGSGGGNDAIGYYTAYAPAADHYSEIVFGTLSNGDASAMVRMAAASPAGYALNCFTGGPYLYKVDAAGGFSGIAGGLTGFGSVHDGTVVRLSAVGSSLSGIVDGGAVGGGMPHTDTSYATGRSGVHIYDGLVRLSQWTGADIGGGPVGVEGTFNGNLPAIGAVVSGAQLDRGTFSGNLPAITGAAAGQQLDRGTFNGNLPAIGGVGTGEQLDRGIFSGDLPAIAGVGVGEQLNRGSFAGDLPAIGVVAFGGGDLAPVTGTAAGTLPAITGIALGEQQNAGTVIGDLPAIEGSGVGILMVSGFGLASLPEITGVGTASAPVSGFGTAFLPIIGAGALAKAVVQAVASGTLPAITSTIVGLSHEVVLLPGRLRLKFLLPIVRTQRLVFNVIRKYIRGMDTMQLDYLTFKEGEKELWQFQILNENDVAEDFSGAAVTWSVGRRGEPPIIDNKVVTVQALSLLQYQPTDAELAGLKAGQYVAEVSAVFPDGSRRRYPHPDGFTTVLIHRAYSSAAF